MTQAPIDSTVPQGQVPSEPSAPDVEFVQTFWGVQTTKRFMLPDNKQFIEIKPMNEGAKSSFQRLTNRGLRMNQQTQDAHIDIDPANERHTLIRESVVDFYLFQPDPRDPRGASEIPTQGSNAVKRGVDLLLENFDPKIIQDLEHFIRMANPWMQADMTLEAALEERSRIEDVIKQIREREAGEGSSSGS